MDCPRPISVCIIDRSNTSVCSTSGVTESRFPSRSIAIHNTMDVNQQLVSPLTRLIGVSPGDVNIKRCRRSISRARLGGDLSAIIVDYIGSINIGLGATSRRLLACIDNLNPALTGGVIRCHGRGKTFTSHTRLGGIPHLKPSTFRRYTNFLHVPKTEGPLSGDTIRPRHCTLIRRVTGSRKIAIGRLIRSGSLRGGVSVGGCIATRINVPALVSVVTRLSGPNLSPHKRIRGFRFSTDVGAVRSLRRNVIIPNVMAGVAGFNTFMSVNIRGSKLIRISRVSGHCVDSPDRIIGLRRRIVIEIARISLGHGHVTLSVGKMGW